MTPRHANEILIIPLLVLSAHASQLRPQTVKAWNEYVQEAISEMQQRLCPGRQFLWSDEQPDRASKLHRGELLVQAASPRSPQKVPFGLIHDWIGAVWIPDVTMADVLAVVRDYDHYKELYGPAVLGSKTICRGSVQDRFMLLLTNKTLLLSIALEGDYKASYVRIDENRMYGIAHTIRVREIERYHQPGERKLQENQGSGLVWRLFSITRLEERDRGVLMELEAIELSRDIPVSIRWFVNPIVARFSKDSLAACLRQTANAAKSPVLLQDVHVEAHVAKCY